MSAQSQAPVESRTDTPSFTPVRTNILQRKCACGGTPGLDGSAPSAGGSNWLCSAALWISVNPPLT